MQHFGTQFIFPRTAGVRRPIAAEIANLLGAGELRQFSKRPGQDGLVARPVVWRPESATHRMIDEGGARRGDFAHDVMGRADDQRRDSVCFDHMSYETDGLMAKRSVGNQQREIDLGLLQIIGDGGRQLVFNFLLPAHAAHEGKMPR